MEGVAPQENLCFFHLCFPFLSTKKVSLGLILSYKDSLKIIRVSQLWTNPAISTWLPGALNLGGAGHGMSLYKTDDLGTSGSH